MSTVDEILASGRYMDRRGRVWILRDFGGGCKEWSYNNNYPFSPSVPHDEFHRHVIHRDVCPGLGDCSHHPVPMVIMGDHVDGEGAFYMAIKSHNPFGKWSHDHAEAMDFARALAVES